jgi:hypothetical protein
MSGQPPDVTPSRLNVAAAARAGRLVAGRAGRRCAGLPGAPTHRSLGHEWCRLAWPVRHEELLRSQELLAIAGVNRGSSDLVRVGDMIAPMKPTLPRRGLPRPIPDRRHRRRSGRRRGCRRAAAGTAYVNPGQHGRGRAVQNYLRGAADPGWGGPGRSPGDGAELGDVRRTWFREQFGDDLRGAPDRDSTQRRRSCRPAQKTHAAVLELRKRPTGRAPAAPRSAGTDDTARRMYRSILEGVAYELRLHLTRWRRPRAPGGFTKHPQQPVDPDHR